MLRPAHRATKAALYASLMRTLFDHRGKSVKPAPQSCSMAIDAYAAPARTPGLGVRQRGGWGAGREGDMVQATEDFEANWQQQ